MKLNDKQNEEIAKFLIDIVKIIVAVFIIGGLVPNSTIGLAHFVVATLCANILFFIAIFLLKEVD